MENCPIGSINNDLSDLSNNNLDKPINIQAYDNYNNLYTFPSDGYVRVDSGTGSGSATITIYGANTTSMNDPHVVLGAAASSINVPNSMFVRKGMKCYSANNGQTNPYYSFYSIT